MPVRSPHAVDPIACVGAHEADTAKDAVVAKDADCGVNVIDIAADAVVANEEVAATALLQTPALYTNACPLLGEIMETSVSCSNAVVAAPALVLAPEVFRNNPA